MHPIYDSFYLDLLRSLEDCKLNRSSEEERLECCYEKALHHWEQLKSYFRDHQFESTAEEVFFFKQVKPVFISEIEYSLLRYQSYLFEPDRDEEARIYFWKMECRKIRTFLANHSAFFDYLDCGDNSMDSQFFLPRNSDGSNFLLFGRS